MGANFEFRDRSGTLVIHPFYVWNEYLTMVKQSWKWRDQWFEPQWDSNHPPLLLPQNSLFRLRFLKLFYYDPPNEVGGSLCFCLVRPASVRGGGVRKKYGLKTRFRGFWVCFGCFWRFRFLSVRPSVRVVDGLCFVQRTCPRVLRFGTWNQSEMIQYILKLCTSYFGHPSRPSVCLREVWT